MVLGVSFHSAVSGGEGGKIGHVARVRTPSGVLRPRGVLAETSCGPVERTCSHVRGYLQPRLFATMS